MKDITWALREIQRLTEENTRLDELWACCTKRAMDAEALVEAHEQELADLQVVYNRLLRKQMSWWCITSGGTVHTWE